MASITCFAQTSMVGMAYGDIVTLEHTPYIDALIAGDRLIPQGTALFDASVAINSQQPETFDLLATATSAASPAEPVTPATVALNEPAPVAVDPAPVAPAPVDPAPAPA